MPHIELSVADADSPDLRRACEKHGVVAKPNPKQEDSVLFSGTRDALAALIREEFDSGEVGGVEYLISEIQSD
ncbi:hypothetical protein [Ralstonia insidiosa]|jgi:hypothetical protein|nr:hypothetical protein [Ralstonia insidiosa]MBA9939262.1 hypothetical protein [Ralstonia insidiosa]MBC9968034.1 hypothetical protein [Ralstonia insidiosa]MBX3904403.1 hypothetical protein [Ralstonia insidiosa]